MDVQWTAQSSLGKCSNTLDNITLDNYYYFMVGKIEKFENLTEMDKFQISHFLKILGIWVEDPKMDNMITESMRENFKLQYWCIKEIAFSSHKVYLKFLTKEMFMEKFFKTCSYKNKDEPESFLNYFIKTVKNELEKISEKQVLKNGY